MDIKFIEINENDFEDFELIAHWDNQSDIKYLIRPNFTKGEMDDIKVESIINGFKSNGNKKIYIISCDDKKIGYISIDTDFFGLYKKEKNSVWIGICIGESEYRGRGIAKKAMGYIEEISKQLNQKRIELGVFEYNKIAIELYKTMGYEKIGEHKNIVYYNGTWHSDIRMEKYI